MIVDLFSGIGWGLGLRELELEELGFDNDHAVIRNRNRLQLLTYPGDLELIDPMVFFALQLEGIIASPPCPDFSQAGQRAGRDGESGHLVDLPLQWALRLQPRWLCWEQVPPVLPIWEHHAFILRGLGYRTWTGILNAADYGVPQTRRRAFLLAHLDRQPYPPEPTHHEHGEGLFGGRPWVSMAEALGWDHPGPARTICGDRGPRWQYPDDSGNRGRMILSRYAGPGNGVVYRDEDEPAFTLTASDDNGNVQWLNARRDQREDGSTQRIPVDQPAPTMSAVRSQWEWGRPATTVACDDRLWPPGHKADKDDPPGRFQQRRGELARRLTVEEGLILQGFPPGVSIEGNKTEQWRLLGNAVPPRWAAQLVAALA